MNEHIAYAMRNEEATQALVYFNGASDLQSWSFLAIQAIIIVGAFLALLHAYRYKQKTGSNSALLTLLNCFLYGLVMDILSYYTVENFWHGEFSVMFLYNKLPLYIALFYPAFMYHSYMLIRRYQFKPLLEAVTVGFFGGFMYLIFDNLGPMLGWWIWDTSDITTLPYINSVPLTSYHWFFTFTAAFALINRVIAWNWPTAKVSKAKIAIATVLQPVATILLGSVFFFPYNVFAKNMPPWDSMPWEQNLVLASLVHVVSFSIAGWLFLSNWRKPRMERDKLLMVFPFMFLAGHAYMYIAFFDHYFSVTADGLSHGLSVGNLIAVIFAIIGCATIVLVSHPADD